MENEIQELKTKLKKARQMEKQKQKALRKEEKIKKKDAAKHRKEEERRRREQHREEKLLKKELSQKPHGESKAVENRTKTHVRQKPQKKEREPQLDLLPMTRVYSYLPIKQIKNGIIHTADNRYVKLVEVLPVNFLLRSPSEQRNIIFAFMSYLKIAPGNMQFKIVSKKADIAEYIEKIHEEARLETDERCRILQEDYARLIQTIGTKEAITRRFFLIFEYQSYNRNKNPDEKEVYAYMKSAVQTAKKYLSLCGNAVLEHDNESRFCVEVLYQILNRQTSIHEILDKRIQDVMAYYRRENGEGSIRHIPVAELFAPATIDFKNRNCVVIDGLYHTYLFIPSQKYRTKVPAGWLSLLINAGEGIDVDMFFFKQDKVKSMERIGRRIRLNYSKIKDTYNMNNDFDDLNESIQAGYYLKHGLGRNEEFYYMSILITVTGHSIKEVEWRAKEMAKLLNSQDIGVSGCMFRAEQAFLSSLPILKLDKKIYERSKRNVLTSGVASCYPFSSYEMSDRDGILLGVNKANNSLVIANIFNTEVYKNANMAILGTSGAGKTFTMQLMALRIRRKNIQVFIIAPDKGHEFARACRNIGGTFIRISPASDNCINIMEIRPVDSSANDILDGSTAERSELAVKIQSLHIFFSLLIPDMTHEEKQLLDDALISTYQKKGITHDNKSLVDPENPTQYKEMPILGDLYEVLLQKQECRRMANILNRLVHGSASSFNQRTNVDLENKYVVLDISELSEDLLLGMFVALDFVWTKAKEDRTVEKAIFIDEAWKLLASNELAGEYLLEIFKVIRAYGGAAICATQDLADFFALKNGKLGRGILNNSKTKILLNMENTEAEQIRRELNLSEAEMMSIVHFERGNGLISTNNNNLVVEFKASQLEKDLITTDRKDLQELKDRIQKFGEQAYGRKGA